MTSLDPPLGHQQEVDWTPIEGKPEPTWVSLTFRGGKDDARLELWTDAPIKDGDEGWKAITFDGDSVVLMCPAEVSFEYTYRAIHPDGGIEWLGNESCNGRVTVRRGRALPKIEGTVTSAISAAQDTTLPGWQRWETVNLTFLELIIIILSDQALGRFTTLRGHLLRSSTIMHQPRSRLSALCSTELLVFQVRFRSKCRLAAHSFSSSTRAARR